MAPPGDLDRAFVAEYFTGEVKIFDVATGEGRQSPFLSLGSGMRLLGLAFHPNYAHNRFFFVYVEENLGCRLIPDGDDLPFEENRNYAIPPDNPFVGTTGENEIWAFGLRNPWRGSFDRETGDYYIGDVGQNTREEIDFEPAGSPGGRNYGWRLREGSIATPTGDVGGPQPPGGIDPIYEYPHGTGPDVGSIDRIVSFGE